MESKPRRTPSSRIMASTEVQETWDAETTSSWSQITDDDDDDDDENTPTRETPEPETMASADRQVTPPAQIVIHTAESKLTEGGGESSNGSSNEEVHSISSGSEQVSASCDLSETPEPEGLTLEALAKDKKLKRIKSQRVKRKGFLDSFPTRYFAYAICLWILELVLVVTLKRAGVIEPEFQLQIAVTNSSMKLPALVLQSLKLWGNETAQSLEYLTQEQKRPGFQLAQKGASAKYPMVLIHGFVTSGLEVWGGKECARKHFRQRMWAGLVGVSSFFSDRDCWRQHMMLDPLTGGDPEGIHLRAATGFEAVDYFMANYWVFGKIIENLADVGYTPSDMTVETYDWRLAFPILEQRDGYFTRLKNRIEAMHKSKKKKVVLTSHSMGALLVHYFFSWVTSPKGGNGGRNWVDRHIHAYINIAGPHLGVPKAVTSLLSGEMGDTVLMNPMAQAVESFFGRKLRRELWNTWGGLWAMIPKGGDALWSVGSDMCPHNDNDNQESNNKTTCDNEDYDSDAKTDDEAQATGNEDVSTIRPTASKDPFCPSGTDQLAPFLTVTDDKEIFDEILGPHMPTIMSRRRNNLIMHKHDQVDHNTTSLDKNQDGVNPLLKHFLSSRDFSLKPVIDYVKEHGLGNRLANARIYSLYGSPSNPTAHQKNEPSWHDPTQTPLPYAPKMKIYCLYGVGKPTERAYYYKLNRPEAQQKNNTPELKLLDPPLILDSEASDPDNNIFTGIKHSDGDGSVPLLSLGYLCADAWTRPSSGLNPSKMDVFTREYRHKAEFTVDDPMRSGPKSGDHVDVLGNVEMTEDLLRILTDFEVDEKVNQNRIVSEIHKIARDIHVKGGGIFYKGNRT